MEITNHPSDWYPPEFDQDGASKSLAIMVLQMCREGLVKTNDTIEAKYVAGKKKIVAWYKVHIRFLDATCLITSWHMAGKMMRVDDRLSGKSYELCDCDCGKIFDAPSLEHLANGWAKRIRYLDRPLPEV